jgi:hypothetical protein
LLARRLAVPGTEGAARGCGYFGLLFFLGAVFLVAADISSLWAVSLEGEVAALWTVSLEGEVAVAGIMPLKARRPSAAMMAISLSMDMSSESVCLLW